MIMTHSEFSSAKRSDDSTARVSIPLFDPASAIPDTAVAAGAEEEESTKASDRDAVVSAVSATHAEPTVHIPIMPEPILAALVPQPGQIFVDGTLGGGGHTELIARRVVPNGWVIGLDRDPKALDRSQQRLAGLPVRYAQANFCNIPEVLEQLQVTQIDGVLLDLGLSSDQLADRERGFSFSMDGPLDLRFDPTEGKSASQLVNRLSEEHLADLIYQYGEDRNSRIIARAICAQRRLVPIETAGALAELIRHAIPAARRPKKIDPATQTFQALRIAVNEELKSLEIALQRIPEYMKIGAKIAILSFHSLEDRRVKEAFRDDPRLKNLTKKPIVADDAELAANPRARSAKLRIAERVEVEDPR